MSKRIGEITVPVYELGERQLAGLRQSMLTAGPHGVSTGGGLGTDGMWVELEADGHMVYRYITGRDVLKAVAELVRHPDADRFPEYKP